MEVCAGTPASLWSAIGQPEPILPFLLRLIPDCPVDSLSRLPQTRRAFDEQAPNVLSVLPLEPPEEEPLDDLAQSVLRLLCREEGGVGGRR